MKVIAATSMLHEDAAVNSATRQFHGEPVLAWTLRRLGQAARIDNVVVLCWDDQAEAARAAGATIESAGNRKIIPQIEAIAAARRWSDGWRGGPLGSTEFDQGFSAIHVQQIAMRAGADAVVLADPAAALTDPQLVDALVDHAKEKASFEHAFLPAAPGFCAMLLRQSLIERLAKYGATPGRVMTYQPDAPMRDPLGGDGCVELPLALARSPRSFKLDSQAQIELLTKAWNGFGGELAKTTAERLVRQAGAAEPGGVAREVCLELTTRRATNPIFAPTRSTQIDRPDLATAVAAKLFGELAIRDDVRITLAGVGDPLMSENLFAIVAAAKAAGVRAVHVETDLLPDEPAVIDRLAESEIDIVSVQLPAVTPQTYANVMGCDRLSEVIDNIKRFLIVRGNRQRGVPILQPTFIKTRQNLAEMEAWYDQWVRAVGGATIAGPSDFGGLIEDCSVGDMSPPLRVPCRRLLSRMTVLCDGTAVSCEQDVLGRRAMGSVGKEPIAEIWRERFGELRSMHADRRWNECELCGKCKEWHRP